MTGDSGTWALPAGWLWSTVGTVYRIAGGGTPSTDVAEYWQGDIPWITSADIHGLRDIRPRKSITSGAVAESAANLVPANSLIVVTRVGLGKVGLAEQPLCFSQDSHALLGGEEVAHPLYSLYYLSQAVRAFRYHNRGTTIAGVTKRQLSELPLPLPSLPEQRRIVARIEELFSQLDAGVEALRRAKAQLRRYRQAVLKHAFEGKLTAAWREAHRGELEPASVLLERIEAVHWADSGGSQASASPAGPYGLPYGWGWGTLGDLVSNFDSRRVPVKESERRAMPGSYPYYGASGVIDYVNAFLFEGQYLLLAEDGANLLSRSTPIAFQARGRFWVNNHAHVLLARMGMPNAYLEHFLNSASLFGYVTGTAQPKLTQKNMNGIPVPVPSLAEQLKIVAEVERRLSLTDEVERAVEAALKRAERLRQSILKRAFEGLLVPQDPNDEPAEKLLQRIRAERGAAAPAQPARRRRGSKPRPTNTRPAAAGRGGVESAQAGFVEVARAFRPALSSPAGPAPMPAVAPAAPSRPDPSPAPADEPEQGRLL